MKVEAGKLELKPTEVATLNIFENSLTMVKEKELKHGLKISLNTQDIPDAIQVDERKFKQILFNVQRGKIYSG